jgi:hypothetical protein
MPRRPRVKVGDVFEIPLSNGKFAYGQYVFADPKMGPLISVFDHITEKSIDDPNELLGSSPKFPPVITGVGAAVRVGLWRVIGTLPITNFKYPKFISTFWDQHTGEASTWYMWDGEKYVRVGRKLPDKLRQLEFLVVWSPYDVMHRIETGEYGFPYGDLIRDNKYVPRPIEPVSKPKGRGDPAYLDKQKK